MKTSGNAVNKRSNHETNFFVAGVCCSTEQDVMTKKLDAAIGSNAYSYNPVTSVLSVSKSVAPQEVQRHLRAIGLRAKSKQEPEQAEPFWKKHRDGALTLSAAMITGSGMILEWYNDFGASNVLFLAAMMLAGTRVFVRAAKAVLIGALDMNVLMSTAAIGAIAIGRWEEGAAVMVLFSVSLMLESYSAARTRRAVQSLMKLSPELASVMRAGREDLVPARDVNVGDLIIVRPGERIPLDGVVLEGTSTVNQSCITGESNQVTKDAGTEVFAGSLNERGSIKYQVTRPYDDSMLAQIVHLVEDAQKNRAPIQSFVDRFARIYTPAVLLIGVAIAILPPILLAESFDEWLYRALVLIVIACPCALVIATPVTLVSAITSAARNGVLIKGGKHLEMLASVKAVAFDKTGTVTDGKHSVTDIVALDGDDNAGVLKIAAAMENNSEHHIGSAIVAHAFMAGIPFEELQLRDFESMPGTGIRAIVNDKEYLLGNHSLCHTIGHCSPDLEKRLKNFSVDGKTPVILSDSDQAIGIIALQDSARNGIKASIQELRQLGVEHVELLSGDDEKTARRIGDAVGIEHVSAQMLPEHKVERIKELVMKHGATAMVGDGINDAPVLATSSVGIAMGVAGSDAALDSADVVLMADEIGKLPYLFSLSKRAMSIIYQNITIALGLKMIFILLSVSGLATLWMAVLADDGAALLVILNGMRMLQFKSDT